MDAPGGRLTGVRERGCTRRSHNCVNPIQAAPMFRSFRKSASVLLIILLVGLLAVTELLL
ncbi:hypothetical protein [Stutzerimonas azotifigens]|uniref:hypothetical protein n=1 Tax=Stutzerimonas azotifigens TaxID=291995 RepID=UPI00040744B9|nr:hypothetical protein [Stutzerimonas azotifigens]